jgi:hypothetical protein
MMKAEFENALKEFANTLTGHVSTEDGQWSVKGFIDAFRNVYTISSDTKIVSKILEIHLFPRIMRFGNFELPVIPQTQKGTCHCGRGFKHLLQHVADPLP